jgi:hypothetical protein
LAVGYGVIPERQQEKAAPPAAARTTRRRTDTMFATEVFYQGKPHSITIVFDTDDPKQAALIQACKTSFGQKYVEYEPLDTLHHLSLDLFPGGLREVRR